MKKNYFLLILIFLTIASVAAQTPICGGTFTDPAGPSANYANNSDFTVTIYPTNPGEVVKVTFTSFSTEASWDGLYVFNGNSIASPQISSGNSPGSVPGGLPGAYWGNTIPGPFTSSSPDGSLTFRFRSDSSTNYSGWIASVTCLVPPTCIAPTALSTNTITQTSAMMNWAYTGATQWEVLLLAGGSSPTTNQTGIATSVNSFTFTGLSCGTSYSAYVKNVCNSSDSSSWAGPVNFTTLGGCTPTGTSTCAGSNSLCDSFGVPFRNTTGVASQGAMGCLGSTSNATWFNFTTSTPGQINLKIEQRTQGSPTPNLDSDYVIFGPYSEPVTPCSQLTPSQIISCSYSASAVEYPSFNATQAGQYYYLMVTNFSNQPGTITITELPTTTASLNCTGFRLNAFLDTNSNGLKDTGEQNFTQGQFQYEKNNDGIIHNIYSSNGTLNLYEQNASNSYNFGYLLNPDYASYYTLTPSSYNNAHIAAAGMTVYNFPVIVSSPYSDISVNIVSTQQPRAGFTYKNKIIYTNNGNQTIASGTVSYTKANVLTITNISQAGTVSTATGFNYDFTNLLPFETRIIEITLQVPNIPIVQLGELINNSTSTTILSGSDLISENNSFNLSQTIIGSYDPNDIIEAHGEKIVHASFTSNDYLYYTIRFENTGTSSALNVRVNDLLNIKLDETSLKMVNASHNYIMDRVGNNINWEFKNIGLTTTNLNPDTSKGYVIYKIKPKPGYAVGDIIPNTTSIYFDFNPAIVTNTFNTEFVSQLGVNEFENAILSCYPNPAEDLVTVAIKNSNTSISNIMVFDVTGKVILNKSTPQGSTSETLDLSGATKGMYLIEITTTSNYKTIKKLLVK